MRELTFMVKEALHKDVEKLHGKELLEDVKFRKEAESDFNRVRIQQEVLKQIAD
ncbi:hypothetical protein DV712_08480 [Parageobacillus thermoglucosidasius]|nr:hypothetical protein DV712_08480 [Parageobacillus thermoglucosidasius]RDE29791.1 hypothetical protein DV714_02055 [Parageobacillus thermoglucosidasius]RDE36449.1 hypothetical protein DV713_02375 [Parageobacillus thermoglucosidasius]REK56239.1 MAG: hypothetical protein C6P36_08880 [Geobacillus sp.]GAJ44095.1 hypothetical protein GT2_14_01090 [Parageobacillus thermoglucosidasius NBRC 107763]